jgi:hypothetical protein
MAAPNIVNVTSIYGKTSGAALGTGTDDAHLTCAAEKVLKVNSIIVANVDGSNSAEVTVKFYDSSVTTSYRIAATVAVAADSSLVVLGKDAPIYLEEGDQIRAGASVAGDLEMVISYEELDDA